MTTVSNGFTVWRAALQPAGQKMLVLLFVGTALGALAGWLGLALGDGTPAGVAVRARQLVPVLALMVPLCLVWLVRLDLMAQRWEAYRPRATGWLHLLLAGAGGGGAAALFYVGAAAQVPAVFGGAAAAPIVQSLAAGRTGLALLALPPLCALVALALAPAAVRRAARED